MRGEMHNIQQNCLEQIETAQAEKQAESDRFTQERDQLEAEAIALQNSFVKQREEMEREIEAEKKQIIDQYEKERSRMTSEFEKEKKTLVAEREDALLEEKYTQYGPQWSFITTFFNSIASKIFSIFIITPL